MPDVPPFPLSRSLRGLASRALAARSRRSVDDIELGARLVFGQAAAGEQNPAPLPYRDPDMPQRLRFGFYLSGASRVPCLPFCFCFCFFLLLCVPANVNAAATTAPAAAVVVGLLLGPTHEPRAPTLLRGTAGP